jgi:hypothetical protein
LRHHGANANHAELSTAGISSRLSRHRFDDGTIVRCHFSFHPVIIGLMLYVACMSALAVVMLHNWTFVLAPLVILLVGVGISWGERELLVSDVANAINAHTEADGRLSHHPGSPVTR